MNLKAPTLGEIQAAQKRIFPFVFRTPLVPLNHNIFLKLENLQPIGSFKIRGAGNAMEIAGIERLKKGVYTASAGNMAQGVAWNAKRLSVRSIAIVPEHAPETKIEAIQRLGGEIIRVPFDQWWNVLVTGKYEGMDGFFIHPVSDTAVMAGNGTIGLEILEDLPDVETIYVPYGDGGLSCGIASAVRAFKPEIRILASEVETAAPFKASLAAGKASDCNYTSSFVDGIGGKTVLPEMWPLASKLLDGSVTVSLTQIADSIRLLALRNRILSEGAGASSVAAALASDEESKTVCVVSGGNIDFSKLTTILNGGLP
jgi:threonine dehydratase